MENRTVFQHAHRERERQALVWTHSTRGICSNMYQLLIVKCLGYQTVPQKQFNPHVAIWEAGTQPSHWAIGKNQREIVAFLSGDGILESPVSILGHVLLI
jgi:hypothetical protein